MSQQQPGQELILLNSEKPTLTQLALVNMPAGSTVEDAQRLVMKEIANIENHRTITPALRKCSPESFLFAVKEAINNNLTLSPSAGLVYLVPGQVVTGQDASNRDIKEWIVTYAPTANGLLSMARQSGRILDNKRPQVKYDAEGKVCEVIVEFLVPSYPTPRWEPISFNNVNFTRWRNACAAKNSGKLTINYTGWNGWIDPEFAGTKAIKHGLKKLGINMNEAKRNPALANAYTPIPADAAMKEAAEENGTEDIKHVEVESNRAEFKSPEGKRIEPIINPNDL